jgi:hypothetical protein
MLLSAGVGMPMDSPYYEAFNRLLIDQVSTGDIETVRYQRAVARVLPCHSALSSQSMESSRAAVPRITLSGPPHRHGCSFFRTVRSYPRADDDDPSPALPSPAPQLKNQ